MCPKFQGKIKPRAWFLVLWLIQLHILQPKSVTWLNFHTHPGYIPFQTPSTCPNTGQPPHSPGSTQPSNPACASPSSAASTHPKYHSLLLPIMHPTGTACGSLPNFYNNSSIFYTILVHIVVTTILLITWIYIQCQFINCYMTLDQLRICIAFTRKCGHSPLS